jgi:TIGR03009 family protein
VVLDRNGPWLRQLWVEQVEGGEDLWDYEKPDPRPDPPLTRELLTEDLPRGWKRIDAGRPPSPPPQEPTGPGEPAVGLERRPEPRLEAVLRDWAKASEAVREAHVQFTQTTKDKTFERTTVQRGEVFVKLPGLVRVNFRDKEGELTEVALVVGRDLHLFNFKARTEQIFQLPEEFGFPEASDRYPKRAPGRWGGQMLEDWVFLGLPTRDLARRFDVRLAKEDQYYTYLDIQPRTKGDRDNFRRARVVLNRDGLSVRQFWFEAPNNTEVTYDFPRRNTSPDPPITHERLLKDLQPLPPGWERLDRRKRTPPPPKPPR